MQSTYSVITIKINIVMMKFILITSVLVLVFQNNLLAQKNEGEKQILTIYDEDGFVNSDEQGLFHYLLNIKSRDTLFESDGYKFIINNRVGFEKYQNLKEVGQNVSIDTIEYLTISDLSKFSSSELHNFLSLQNKIFLVLGTTENHLSLSKIATTYIRYPIIYKGTEKNIEMMKN